MQPFTVSYCTNAQVRTSSKDISIYLSKWADTLDGAVVLLESATNTYNSSAGGYVESVTFNSWRVFVFFLSYVRIIQVVY